MNCIVCNKKINQIYVSIYTCRCKNIYCRDHMLSHPCTFDYKKFNAEKIKRENVYICAQKI